MSDDDRLLHHEYDGIQEYDNPLPFWWKGIFVLSIAHAAGYLYWYHLGGPGPSEHEVYAGELRAHEARLAAAPKNEVPIDEATLAELASNPDTVARGRAVFAKNCAGCHVEDGRGLVGPNLTDSFQIHGDSRLHLYTTIHDGVVEKGMLAWSTILPPDELVAATAFVITLRGDELQGKAAEGRHVKPFGRSP